MKTSRSADSGAGAVRGRPAPHAPRRWAERGGPGAGQGRAVLRRRRAGAMPAVLGAAWALLAAGFLVLLLLHRAQARRPGGGTDIASAFFQDLIRYGKTKRGGQQAAWLRRLQVPKR